MLFVSPSVLGGFRVKDEIVDLLSENLEQEEATADKLESAMPTLLEKAMQTASKSASN